MAENPNLVGTEPSLADVQADLERLRADLAKLVETLGGAARQSVKGAAGEAEAAAGEVTDWAQTQANSISETIKAQPLTAIAIAAGVGLVLGHLMQRR